MSLHFFFVPAARPGAAQEELNRFLVQERVLTLTREFVADGANSGWAVCVEVAPGPAELPQPLRAESRRGGGIDYKQVLAAADFEVFAALRELRKQLARAEGVPVYAVFSNEQLAEIARRRPDTPAALGAMEGVGNARIDKYASAVLGCLAQHQGSPAP